MKIEKNVSLKSKNWFQTGGAAEFFCAPTTEQEFVEALAFAREHNLAITLLGLGANVLVSDNGISGLVIRPSMRDVTVHDAQVTAMAGTPIQLLINKCLDHNLIGLEEFSGIPGTVGGATYMNVHYFKSSWADFVVSAQVIEKETGTIISVDKDWFNYGYDTSTLHDKKYYLVSTTLELKQGTELDAAYARGRRDEIIRQRNSRYPTNRTCGSFFRNFLPHELTNVKNAQPLPFVAYYLDKLGIKGELSVGDAIVSPKHVNMIENRGNATSNDIIELARTMQKMVFERFGIMPQVECQLLGFDGNPI